MWWLPMWSVKATRLPFDAAIRGIKKLIEEKLRLHLLTPALDARGEYDLFEMQQVFMSTVFADGECFLRWRPRTGTFATGLALPFQFEMIEADRLDKSITSHGLNQVVEGVEYGPTGQIEAYHLPPYHPGSVEIPRSRTTSRVSAIDVIHGRRFNRSEQLRGVPWLAPVMMTIGELSDYQETQIMKQRMSWLLAFMLKWTGGVGVGKSEKGLDKSEPGAIFHLPEGAEPVPVDPPRVEEYPAFMKQGLQAIAAGIGITYESLAVDLESVNFSSARYGRNEMDRLVRMWQRNIMIAQFGGGIERWFRNGLSVSGKAGMDFTLDWTPPRRILVDPTREIPAMIEEVESGLNSCQGVQRELGRDPERIREERVQDMQADEAVNLSSASDEKATEAGRARAEADNIKDQAARNRLSSITN
ncbi:phage portal protein [Paracoccus albus]|uniref:phage portal protein n=1 Tax=Paracoccus albus TaxID=3017784 RepID=UPI0022F09839|nr:phage portal protein [Paracoccus albus]WBU59013.1 phage portal protein [Paracoccus albus]